MTMKAGSIITGHRPNEAASILTLSGHVGVRRSGGFVDLPTGVLLVLDGGLQHSVAAVEESAVLLTLGWHGAR